MPTSIAGSPARVEAGPRAALEIEIDESSGTLRVYDPRLFREGRRAFCEGLLRAAAKGMGLRRAAVDLARASCLLEFDADEPRLTRDALAGRFVEAVREATGIPADEVLPRFRRPRAWTGLAAIGHGGVASVWEIAESGPDRLTLRRDSLGRDRAELGRLADRLADTWGIASCRVSPWSRVLTVLRQPDGPGAHEILDDIERALREPAPGPALATVDGVDLATGWKRFAYVGLAGGSFGLSIIGLIVPGVPTVPFLLATGYYLARSSPYLNDRLRRAPFFGPIVREAEDYEAMSVQSKEKLAALTVTTVVVTILVAPITPLLLGVMVLVSSVSLYGIASAPAIEPPSGRPRLALLAP